ncbi:MAG TPA: hypothetical protein VIG08_03600 [Gemmatimonadales bacterium]|jgi:hypothetical protein
MSPTRRLTAAVKALGIAAIAGQWAIGCGGSTCNCDSADDATFAPKVTALDAGLTNVQVIPSTSTAFPGRRFQLTAWFRGADGKIIAGRFNPMKWTFEPPSDGSSDGNVLEGRVEITKFPTADLSNATVKAEKDDDPGISDEVGLTLWRDASAAMASGDVVTAHHTNGMPPNIVLLEESDGAKCTWGPARAFVGAAEVGKQGNAPCSLSLLSSDHAMSFTVPGGTWGGGSQRDVGLMTRAPLNIRVFIAVTGRSASILSGIPLSNSTQLATDVADAAMAQARSDVDWVNLVWEANRVGVHVNAQYNALDPTTPELAALIGAQPQDCYFTSKLQPDQKNSAKSAFIYDPSVVSVYYVDWIDYPTDPLHPGSRGLNCDHLGGATPTAGPIIYVSYTRHSSITLTHELGHVLGLKDEEPTMGENNVMYGMAPDGSLGADARSRLTVGQVFRMNIWNDSWFAIPQPSAQKRYCDAVQPCPLVTTDAQ